MTLSLRILGGRNISHIPRRRPGLTSSVARHLRSRFRVQQHSAVENPGISNGNLEAPAHIPGAIISAGRPADLPPKPFTNFKPPVADAPRRTYTPAGWSFAPGTGSCRSWRCHCAPQNHGRGPTASSRMVVHGWVSNAAIHAVTDNKIGNLLERRCPRYPANPSTMPTVFPQFRRRQTASGAVCSCSNDPPPP